MKRIEWWYGVNDVNDSDYKYGGYDSEDELVAEAIKNEGSGAYLLVAKMLVTRDENGNILNSEIVDEMEYAVFSKDDIYPIEEKKSEE